MAQMLECSNLLSLVLTQSYGQHSMHDLCGSTPQYLHRYVQPFCFQAPPKEQNKSL